MTWTQDPRTFTSWNVERTGSTRRITEDGKLRVTARSNIRIIERFPFAWVNETQPFNPWTVE